MQKSRLSRTARQLSVEKAWRVSLIHSVQDSFFQLKSFSDQEKNWGQSFPSAWTWSQAISLESPGLSYVLAGGQLLGVKSIMVNTRLSNGLEWDFRPPLTINIAGWSLGFQEEYDNQKGTLKINVSDWTRKVTIQVRSTQVGSETVAEHGLIPNQPIADWLLLSGPMYGQSSQFLFDQR